MNTETKALSNDKMSRLKRFAHALLSSYLLLATNVLYTLASVPLALHYLPRREFGLWVVTLQIVNFIALIDLGMGSSISRILIDHKDERANGRYGGAIQSGFLVGLAQGLIVLIVGLSLLKTLPITFRVPNDLSNSFFWLMVGQIFLAAATFSSRIFGQMLYAWQRMDISNYSGIVQLVGGFAAMWAGFSVKCGIFSLLIGAATGYLLGFIINVSASLKLGFWPKRHEWGRASREQFRELFSYGAEVFLISVGTQLILSSQVMLVSRQLGMEAAALWSVMTKVFTLVSQMVWKMIGNAMPTFAEMQVRGEQERLWNRYRGLFITTNVFAGVCGILFAACNGPFVALWTHGKFSWPAINNVLLALWLVLLTQQCCHNSLIVCFKEIRGLKFVYLAEGVVFIGIALIALRHFGITGMLVCSVVATFVFTWITGTWRLTNLSGMGWKPFLLNWQKPLFRILVTMVPIWLATEWVLYGRPDWLRLIVSSIVLTILGAWISIRYALPSDLVADIAKRLPRRLQWIVEK